MPHAQTLTNAAFYAPTDEEMGRAIARLSSAWRWCSRCECRLSRWNSGRHCAPCHRALGLTDDDELDAPNPHAVPFRLAMRSRDDWSRDELAEHLEISRRVINELLNDSIIDGEIEVFWIKKHRRYRWVTN